ncbi:MAG: AMP-binding protein [Candidatus Obscuribacterales bacterium]|nr:AMP-binding protein [Candidatus Obscuribacterales bacterium]
MQFKSFIEEYEKIIEQFGERPAVIEEVHETSHAILYKEALTLAAAIKSRDGKLVVLALPKSYDYIRALLAVWMAGKAFTPLDVNMPETRMKCILSEVEEFNGSQTLIITKEENQAKLNNCTSNCVFLTNLNPEEEEEEETAATGSLLHRPSPIEANDLAYVIFTSGSTGAPKGVLVEHKGLVNLLNEQIKAFRLDHLSRSLFYLSISFDASISDIGTALLSGAALVILPPQKLSPERLNETFTTYGITYIDIPPSVLKLLKPEEKPESLNSMVIGGEVCPSDVVRQWARALHLVCVYGPTEATICTSYTVCDQTWDKPLIGKPIANIKYHLNEEDAELYISGLGLARGYLFREKLTAERFIIDANGERLYATRDRVVAQEDGNFVFCGRIDRQFKLRGMLIEPEEIEAVLMENSLVKRAAVGKRRLANRDREILVAYLELTASTTDVALTLRQFLSERLPKWMLPHRFLFVDKMPQTASGKVDLAALEKLAINSHSLNSLDSPKSNNSKRGAVLKNGLNDLLKTCAADVLGCDCFGDDENFFDLGLDSLSTVELAAALCRVGLAVSPETIFKHPNVKQLGQHLQNVSSGEDTGEGAGAGAAASLANGESSESLRTLIEQEPIKSQIAAIESLFEITADGDGQTLTSSSQEIRTDRQTLITGAAGFLGTYLLAELLSRGDSKFVAVVRAKDKDEATNKLLRNAERYSAKFGALFSEAIKSGKLAVLLGDIEEERLGLDESTYWALCQNTGRVIHLAAQVNMAASRQELINANVIGTLNIARLAAATPSKELHYCSTLSVFVATDRNRGNLLESDDLSSETIVYGGYAQTKWLAEVILRKLAASQGPAYTPPAQEKLGQASKPKNKLDLTVYRLGLITGDQKQAIAPSNDFLGLFIKGLYLSGIGEEHTGDAADAISMDISPVDYVATTMAELMEHDQEEWTEKSLQPNQPKTFHIANNTSLSLKRLALLVDETSSSKLGNGSAAGENKAVGLSKADIDFKAIAAAKLAICRLYSPDEFQTLRTMDLFQATGVDFDMENTRRALPYLSFPQISDQLLKKYIAAALGG